MKSFPDVLQSREQVLFVDCESQMWESCQLVTGRSPKHSQYDAVFRKLLCCMNLTVSVTLPCLMGDKGLNGDADHKQDEQYPQVMMLPAAQHSSHTPAVSATHTHTLVLIYK